MAIPGSVVASGKLITPGGAQGPAGQSSAAWTQVAGSSFTVPPYGSTVIVNLLDTSWMALGEWIYIDDAGGLGVAGQLVVQSKTPTSATLLNPQPGTTPLASPSNDGLLRKVSGNTSDFVDGTNNSQPIAPQITAVRLRAWNSLGNPNFECDQRNCNNVLTYAAGNIQQLQCDRWQIIKNAATGVIFAATNTATGSGQQIPGTTFRITRANLGMVVNTAQATLAAPEYLMFAQTVEGPQWRELCGDVHSVSLMVQCSIASFQFAVSLRAIGGGYSLVLPCVTPATPNTWGMVTLPNLPVWSPSATWSVTPGVASYTLGICLGTGATYQAPSTGSWLAGNYLGYVGQPNFLASPVNSNFYLGFVQHEPGAVCSTFMDKPFTQNLDECLRYYQKSYPYATAVGTASNIGAMITYLNAGTNPQMPMPFKKIMAKAPTVVGYSSTTGAVNTVRDASASLDKAISSVTAVGDGSFSGFGITSPNAALWQTQFHYTADTGW